MLPVMAAGMFLVPAAWFVLCTATVQEDAANRMTHGISFLFRMRNGLSHTHRMMSPFMRIYGADGTGYGRNPAAPLRHEKDTFVGGFFADCKKKDWHHEKQKTSLCSQTYSEGAQGQ